MTCPLGPPAMQNIQAHNLGHAMHGARDGSSPSEARSLAWSKNTAGIRFAEAFVRRGKKRVTMCSWLEWTKLKNTSKHNRCVRRHQPSQNLPYKLGNSRCVFHWRTYCAQSNSPLVMTSISLRNPTSPLEEGFVQHILSPPSR